MILVMVLTMVLKVLIIMAIVNKIDIKTESTENYADFASNFSQRINWYSSEFDEVRVIFKQYDINSLKENTRAGRKTNSLSQFIIKSLKPHEFVT